MRSCCIFEEPLQFYRLCYLFIYNIYFLLSVYLCTFRFSLPVSSWLTPLKCLSRCGLLFSVFFILLFSGFPSRAWRKAEGDSKQYNPRGERLRWPTCFTKLWAAFLFICSWSAIYKIMRDKIMGVHILVKYVGGYHGLLSGVTVRPGSVEPHSVVECLYACREGLDFGDLETLGSGMKVTSCCIRTRDCCL